MRNYKCKKCAFMEHNKEVVRENTSFIDKWLSGSMTKDGSIDLDIVKQLNDRILSLFKKGVEEMSELQKELVKHIRGNDNHEAILEELADATIMLEQVRRYFDIRPIELLAKKKDKLNRQWEREGL